VQDRLGAMLQVGRVPETLKVREHIDLFSSYYPNPLPLQRRLRSPASPRSKTVPMASYPAGRNSACCSASPSGGNPDLLFSTSPRWDLMWKRAA